MTDILLIDAVLCWNPARNGTPAFAVTRKGSGYGSRTSMPSTGGAVYSSWKEGDTDKRLRMLFGEVMSIMARDGVPFELIHPELLKIPEYRREILSPDSPGAETVYE